jgi:hypothetical protein
VAPGFSITKTENITTRESLPTDSHVDQMQLQQRAVFAGHDRANVLKGLVTPNDNLIFQAERSTRFRDDL